LCEHFTGFHVQYLKASGALGTYYPDFVVVQKANGHEQNWIVETKGQEDVEVAAKDEQMRRWCAEVSFATGAEWAYAKVPYRLFHGKHFASFDGLRKVLAGETGQLILPISESQATRAATPPAGPPQEVVAAFWRAFGKQLPKGALVLTAAAELDPRTVRTALDHTVCGDYALARAYLFFVDLEPEANWAHSCAYVFVPTAGEAAWCEAEWPPHASLVVKTQVRP
jgi:hypothetical protein